MNHKESLYLGLKAFFVKSIKASLFFTMENFIFFKISVLSVWDLVDGKKDIR